MKVIDANTFVFAFNMFGKRVQSQRNVCRIKGPNLHDVIDSSKIPLILPLRLDHLLLTLILLFSSLTLLLFFLPPLHFYTLPLLFHTLPLLHFPYFSPSQLYAFYFSFSLPLLSAASKYPQLFFPIVCNFLCQFKL